MNKNKRMIGLFLLLVFITAGMPEGWAVSEVKTYSWWDKLKRGALNIVTSPVEVARDIHVTTEEKNLLIGWTVGLAKGFGDGILRFGVGVIDLFTFPFDFPDDEKAPLIDPEFVWQKPGPKYL